MHLHLSKMGVFLRRCASTVGASEELCVSLALSLEAQGISDPSDVGVLAPGGVLPPTYRNVLLGPVGKDGGALLSEAVVRSRRILLPSIERQVMNDLRNKAPQAPPLLALRPKQKARSSRPPSQQQLQAAQRRVNSFHAARGPALQQPISDETLHAKEDAKLNKAIDRGVALIYLLGREAPRMLPLLSSSPTSPLLDESHIMLLRDVVKDKITSARNLERIIRGAEGFVKHARAVALDLTDLTAWDLGAYLQLEKARPHGKPALLLRSVTWLSRAGGFNWPTTDPLVKAQCEPQQAGATAEPPAQAPCPTLDMLKKMEANVFDAGSLVLRVYAGFIALLAHGCLRYSDAQHSKGLCLTADAIVGKSWKMKKRRHHVPWAALRQGVAGTDWGAHWLTQLTKAGLPGPDFLLKAPSLDLRSFKASVATYSDVSAVMRALLMLSGSDAAEALAFTPHSWRHIYPTMGRQLQVPDAQLEDVGHWKANSGMPRRYDSAACVTELAVKSSILSAVAAGWTPVASGCVPLPAPATPAPATPALAAAPSTPSGPPVKRRCAAPSHNPHIQHHPGEHILTDDTRVLNKDSSLCHFYAGNASTRCGTWRCGTPAAPAANADFLDAAAAKATLQQAICKKCRSSRLKELTGQAAASSPRSPSSASASPSPSSSSGSSSASVSIIAIDSDHSEDWEVRTPTH